FNGISDGKIRLYELSDDPSLLTFVNVQHGSGTNDLVFTATFMPAPVDEDTPSPINLGGPATVTFNYPDLRDADTFTPVSGNSAGSDLLNFLNVSANNVFSGLTDFANWMPMTLQADVFGVKLGLTTSSIGDILAGTPNDQSVPNSSVSYTSAVGS